MSHESLHRSSAGDDFDCRYRELADAWASHQELKMSGAPLAQLADSNAHLYRKRMAMASWRHHTLR